MIISGSTLVSLFCLVTVFLVSAEGSSELQKPEWPPSGERVKLIVTRDTFISSMDGEVYGSNGSSEKLKVKGRQEYSLLDVDPQEIKGRIVDGALLHIRSASPKQAPLARIGVSTVASGWVEGSASGYNEEPGSSCYNQAEYKERDWAYPGSTLMDVVFGRGHTIWKFADCSMPDRRGWQTCAVSPDVVAARSAGISHGFVLYDEVGNIWSCNNKTFTYTYFPNRIFYSRESSGNEPWLEVWLGQDDSISPEPVASISVGTRGLPAGQAVVRWKTPPDHGGGKTLGFNVTYGQNDASENVMPRYLIPMAGRAGEEVLMHIQDLPLGSGEDILLAISPVDSVGNVGRSFTDKVSLSAGSEMPQIAASDIGPFRSSPNLPSVSGVKVSVVDTLDKVDPGSGEVMPLRAKGYKGGNHIYSAARKLVRLQSARNETVSFQLNLEGKMRDQQTALSYVFDDAPELETKVYQFAYVKLEQNGNVMPDPLVPVEGSIRLPSNSGLVRVSDQTNHSLICEVYVPHGSAAGRKKGKLVLRSGSDMLEIEVDLTVWDFTLPDKLSFIPEMNSYGMVSPYRGYDYYRLAHEHRTCLNRVPYGWNGNPEYAPEWDGERYVWREWDRAVGPLLDGSAFADMRRGSEPVDVFYLPFSENWPVNLFDNYTPSYWADEAFTDAYRDELLKGFRCFATHINEKKWHDTIFQFYLNNKVYYRKNYSRSSAPWIFDEPVNTQDFWALRWYGLLWREAVDPVKGDAKLWYRGDLSLSQFARDMLWGVMDMEYIGSNSPQKRRMKRDERVLGAGSWLGEYGSANMIDASNFQPVMWSLSAWSGGADAVLPWQTIGSSRSWQEADQNALFYPYRDGPVPSVRLKAFMAGQQFVEYLTLLSHAKSMPRYAVAEWLSEEIDLDGFVRKEKEGDAGTPLFDNSAVIKLWEVRYRIGKTLSEIRPEYRRSLVNQSDSGRKRRIVSGIGYVRIAPEIESYKPECESFSP